MTSERRDELLLKCDGSSLRLSHSDKDGLGNVLTRGELRELLQAHKKLETAVKLLHEQASFIGRVGLRLKKIEAIAEQATTANLAHARGHILGWSRDFLGKLVEHRRPLDDYLAVHDARTGAGTAAREGGGDG